jgi:hypothetical protein
MSEVAHEADISRHYKIDASDPKEKSACVPWSKPIACREALEPCGNMIICGRSRTLVTTLSIASLSYWRTSAASVLIAYHSASGNTEKMAQGVVERVKGVTGTNAVLKRVDEVTAQDLLSADGWGLSVPDRMRFDRSME